MNFVVWKRRKQTKKGGIGPFLQNTFVVKDRKIGIIVNVFSPAGPVTISDQYASVLEKNIQLSGIHLLLPSAT